MANMKRLVVVVECSKPMVISWRTILRDYIQKLLISFLGSEATDFKLARVELNAPDYNAVSVAEPSIWTTNVGLFLDWLDTLEFTDDDSPDVAIAEGLREALKLFPSPTEGQNEDFQNHCILAVATESHVSEAETVAKSFPQSFVSLSVICPTQLSGIESIYNAGKKNPLAADHTISLAKNPHFLVLISENFIQACADLSDQSGITTLPSNQSCTTEEFVQAWEGNLAAILNGQTVSITSLTGHLSLTASKSLVEDWPSTMLIDRLVPADFFENKCDGTEEHVIFKPMDQHILLEKLHKNKLFAIILLPSQVLAVIAPVKEEEEYQMVGMLLPKDALAEDLSQYLQD